MTHNCRNKCSDQSPHALQRYTRRLARSGGRHATQRHTDNAWTHRAISGLPSTGAAILKCSATCSWQKYGVSAAACTCLHPVVFEVQVLSVYHSGMTHCAIGFEHMYQIAPAVRLCLRPAMQHPAHAVPPWPAAAAHGGLNCNCKDHSITMLRSPDCPTCSPGLPQYPKCMIAALQPL